jgi:hypothetical protein
MCKLILSILAVIAIFLGLITLEYKTTIVFTLLMLDESCLFWDSRTVCILIVVRFLYAYFCLFDTVSVGSLCCVSFSAVLLVCSQCGLVYLVDVPGHLWGAYFALSSEIVGLVLLAETELLILIWVKV